MLNAASCPSLHMLADWSLVTENRAKLLSVPWLASGVTGAT